MVGAGGFDEFGVGVDPDHLMATGCQNGTDAARPAAGIENA